MTSERGSGQNGDPQKPCKVTRHHATAVDFNLPEHMLAALLSTVTHAAAPAPLRTELTLTHIAAGKWRADYVFAKPVTAVELGAQAGRYRQQAWRALTPGVTLVAREDKESLRSAAPLTRLSVEISAYDDFAEGQYALIDRLSDGG